MVRTYPDTSVRRTNTPIIRFSMVKNCHGDRYFQLCHLPWNYLKINMKAIIFVVNCTESCSITYHIKQQSICPKDFTPTGITPGP